MPTKKEVMPSSPVTGWFLLSFETSKKRTREGTNLLLITISSPRYDQSAAEADISTIMKSISRTKYPKEYKYLGRRIITSLPHCNFTTIVWKRSLKSTIDTYSGRKPNGLNGWMFRWNMHLVSCQILFTYFHLCTTWRLSATVIASTKALQCGY